MGKKKKNHKKTEIKEITVIEIAEFDNDDFILASDNELDQWEKTINIFKHQFFTGSLFVSKERLDNILNIISKIRAQRNLNHPTSEFFQETSPFTKLIYHFNAAIYYFFGLENFFTNLKIIQDESYPFWGQINPELMNINLDLKINDFNTDMDPYRVLKNYPIFHQIVNTFEIELKFNKILTSNEILSKKILDGIKANTTFGLCQIVDLEAAFLLIKEDTLNLNARQLLLNDFLQNIRKIETTYENKLSKIFVFLMAEKIEFFLQYHPILKKHLIILGSEYYEMFCQLFPKNIGQNLSSPFKYQAEIIDPKKNKILQFIQSIGITEIGVWRPIRRTDKIKKVVLTGFVLEDDHYKEIDQIFNRICNSNTLSVNDNFSTKLKTLIPGKNTNNSQKLSEAKQMTVIFSDKNSNQNDIKKPCENNNNNNNSDSYSESTVSTTPTNS